MNRVDQHEIDTLAQRVFINCIPPSWVARRQDPDYGIDYEVEIFENQKPTGIVFSVQLKGSRSLQYKEYTIKFKFETDKLLYYSDQVKRPVFLVVVDVETQNAFWLFCQKYVWENLDIEKPKWKNQTTVTLDIPRQNNFIESIESFIAIVAEAELLVLNFHYDKARWEVIAAVTKMSDSPDKINQYILDQRDKSFHMEYHLASVYLNNDEREKSQKVFLDLEEKSLINRDPDKAVQAALGFVQTLNVVDENENRIGAAHLLSILCNIKDISSGPVYVARIEKCFMDYVYYFKKVQDLKILYLIAEQGVMGSEYFINLEIIRNQEQYYAALQEQTDIIATTIEVGEYAATCIGLVRLADTHLYAYPYSYGSKETDEAEKLLKFAKDYLDMAQDLAKGLKSDELTCFVLQSVANLQSSNEQNFDETLDLIIEIAKKASLRTFKKAAETLKKTLAERVHPRNIAFNYEPSNEEEEIMYRHLAKLAGIDLSNEDDPITKVVKIGLKDRNPERILKTCEHLWIALGSRGLPAEILGLPTAGSKFLYCDIENTCIYGMDLDRLLDQFVFEHCKKCKQCKPRPSNWKWSREWHEKIGSKLPDKFKEIINAFFNY